MQSDEQRVKIQPHPDACRPDEVVCNACKRPYTREDVQDALLDCPECHGDVRDPYSGMAPWSCARCNSTGKVPAFILDDDPEPDAKALRELCEQLREALVLVRPKVGVSKRSTRLRVDAALKDADALLGEAK